MRIFSRRTHSLRQPLWVGIALFLPFLGFAQIPTTISPPSVDTPIEVLRDASIEFPDSARFRVPDAQVVRLDMEVITVQPGDAVVSLLADNGIRQNATSLALLYELNPQLEDIRKIMVGERIVVPTVEGPQSLDFAFRRGYRVELLLNQLQATQTLSLRTGQIKELETTMSQMADARFGSLREKAEVLQLIGDALSALQTLENPDHRMIVSKKVAMQAAVEGEGIRSKLSNLIASGQPISLAAIEGIKENAENLKAIGQEVKSGGSGLVRTTIRTNGADGEPVKQLTVWYSPEGDRNKKYPCSMTSSPSIEAIARGEYVFWATRGNQVVTDEKPRKIRSFTRDTPLDLPVR